MGKLGSIRVLLKKAANFKDSEVKREIVSRFSEDAEVEYYTRPSLKKEEAELLKNLKGSILDIGCASGRVPFMLAQRGLKITAIDISQNMIQKAKSVQKRLKLSNIKFIKADVQEFNTANKFDNVLCIFNVFSYFTSDHDRVKVLKKMRSFLKPNGKLFITVNHKFYWRSILKLVPLYLIGKFFKKDFSFGDSYNSPMFTGSKRAIFQHFFSKRELKSLATSSGFDGNSKIQYAGELFGKHNPFFLESALTVVLKKDRNL